MVGLANMGVFFRAQNVGLDGTEGPGQIPSRALEAVEADSVSPLARVVGERPPVLPEAYPGTAAACTAAAAIPGTLPAEVARPLEAGRWAIGHPSGVMTVASEVWETEGTYRVVRAAYARTARRLLEGIAYGLGCWIGSRPD